MNKYDYLNDKQFLKALDMEERKVKYIRLFLLDFQTEQVIANIEGKATGGSINLNGSSNMRRVMNCSLIVDKNGIQKQGSNDVIYYNNITEIENLISLNKKVRAEVGFENTLRWDSDFENYAQYEKIWIPLGIFIIKTASIAKSNGGITLSLNFNDKTALLNGDCGGIIPAATIFSESENYTFDYNSKEVEKVHIKDIIKHLVCDFGGEPVYNIIIDDIPDYIRKVVKWVGNNELYYYEDENNPFFTLTLVENKVPTRTFSYGMDIGYKIEPFYYPGKLECNAGESVASVLDKIKNALGNFEWFYDINGKFRFQEKKNYINNSITSSKDLKEYDYLSIMNPEKSVYTFDESNRKLITNISNSPQYQNIKNDFVVWGVAKSASGMEKPIRYHLAFDSKPAPSTLPRLGFWYEDTIRKCKQVVLLTESNYEEFNEDQELIKEKYYLDTIKKQIVAWNEDEQDFIYYDNYNVCYFLPSDWRSELYFQGLESKNKTFANNYYAAELNAEFPKQYDVCNTEVEKDTFGDLKYQDLNIYKGEYINISEESLEFYLDFIEGQQGGNVNLAQYNVHNIGRRTAVDKDNSANCIFASSPPTVIIIPADGDVEFEYQNALSGYLTVQVSLEIDKDLIIGGNQISAFDKVKEFLVQHSQYNEAISITTIPIYYLEPNTRIHIEDNSVTVNGDYLINTISLPLGNGTSTISCVRCIEKTI